MKRNKKIKTLKQLYIEDLIAFIKIEKQIKELEANAFKNFEHKMEFLNASHKKTLLQLRQAEILTYYTFDELENMLFDDLQKMYGQFPSLMFEIKPTSAISHFKISDGWISSKTFYLMELGKSTVKQMNMIETYWAQFYKQGLEGLMALDFTQLPYLIACVAFQKGDIDRILKQPKKDAKGYDLNANALTEKSKSDLSLLIEKNSNLFLKKLDIETAYKVINFFLINSHRLPQLTQTYTKATVTAK